MIRLVVIIFYFLFFSMAYAVDSRTNSNSQRDMKSEQVMIANVPAVVFRQQGAGAVERTLQDKLSDSKSIKDFGARSDGITDDSAAVQAAINSITDYAGGVIVIPPNTAVGSTITIQEKKGIILTGLNGQGFPFVGKPFMPTLKWIGAVGGTVVHIINPLEVTLRNMSISGEDIADYGLRISGARSGWGVSNYEHLSIYGNNKNAMLKDATESAGDFGRNHFLRVTFACSHAASGVPVNDACVVYNHDSSVQDVYDHCEFIYADGNGNSLADTYAFWVEAGTPRIHFLNNYTKAKNGIFTKTSGATPKFVLTEHYSEDVNFIRLPNANTNQVLRNVVHALGGGVSISWDGSSGGGVPLVIDGGYFSGGVALSNMNAGVMLVNSPTFLGGFPIFTDSKHKIIIGRSNGAASTETHGAINAAGFVPFQAKVQSAITINPVLSNGTVFPVSLTGNSTVASPGAVDVNGLDVGREIEFRITGHIEKVYTVTFSSVFKLSGGRYVHSGISKTDVIRFRFDGKNWWEAGRVMNM